MVENSLGYCDTCRHRNNVILETEDVYFCPKVNICFTNDELLKPCLDKEDIIIKKSKYGGVK